MRKPRCYFVNTKNIDVSPAAVYGDIVALYDEAPKNVFNTSTQAFHLKTRLKDAQSNDYMIVGGNATLQLIVFGILYERFGFVNMLLYDIRSNQYMPRVLPRHQMQMQKEE